MADDQERAAAAAAAADEDMADASSDGSSSDSDFEEIELSPEDAKLLMKLEQQLAANPNLYDSHVQYIEALRRCKMGARLGEARQAFHAAFPLTEALWFDWLSDEIEGLSDADDIPRIEGLMEAAVADYLSIPLWVQLLEFMRDFDPEVQAGGKEGHARMRDACERALTAGGLHVTEGSKLWGIYRGYELSLLEAQPSEEQAERVRGLWTRQLAVPLADGPDSLTAYEAWERSRPGGEGWQLPSHVKQAYERARRAVELRQPYEESVAAGREPGPELLAAFMAYIRVEEKQADPARVQVVYERAVAAFPVTHYLWAQYAGYLEAHLKIGSVINSVYARAVRNCPWVGQLWGRALRALERSGAPEEQHAALYDKALSAGLQGYEDYMEVILARTDCLRRQGGPAADRLRSTFKAAAELLRSYFPDYVDRSFRLTAYWAECEARVCDDLPAARAVWEVALKEPAGRYADTWAAYIDFERRRGHTREARTLYKRCYTRKLEEGGQAIMCDAWLRFEREEGSAEDHLLARLKVEPILQELQAAATAAADPGQHAAARSAADKAPKLSKEEVRAMRQQADPNFGKRKQPQQPQQAQGGAAAGGGGGDMPPPPAKKPRTAATGANTQQAAAPAAAGQQAAQAAQQPQQQPEQQPVQQEEATAGAAASAPAEQQQEQQQQAEGAGGQEGETQEQQAARLQGAWRQQRHTAPNTVFVKHLADEVDEAAVKQLFDGCPGGVTSVELGRDKKTGRSRGFAYVHLATVEGLEAACRLDRSEFHGKHILVAPSKPPGGGGQAGGRGGGRFGGGRGQEGGRGGGRGQEGGRGGGRGQEGGRGGGRFGGGRGFDGGRGSGRDGGRGRGGRGGPRHHTMIDLGEGQPASGDGSTAPPRGFVPRAAALGGKGQQQGGGQAAEGGAPAANDAPKSNADFRAMFLKK